MTKRSQLALLAILCMAALNSLPTASYGYQYMQPTLIDSIGAPVEGKMPASLHLSKAVVRLYFHVVTDEFGRFGWSSSQIEDQVDRIREDYAAVGIYFNVVGYEEVRNTEWQLQPAGNFGFMKVDESNRADAINIWLGLHEGNPIPQVSGLPGTIAELVVDGTAYDFSWPGLTQLLGWCLGLYATEACVGGCDSPGGPNCDGTGDWVCDTPPNPCNGESGRGFMWQHVDPDDCTYDDFLAGWDPMTNNFMTYNWLHCLDSFTDGQGARMRLALEYHGTLRDIKDVSLTIYENKSTDTGLDYDGTPYSSVTLDYNDDGLKDLFIAVRDEAGRLLRQDYLTSSDVPYFTDRTGDDFAQGDAPQIGLRGACVADYDNDGHVDLFAAAATDARLYHNNGGSFADSASVVGLVDYAEDSYAGAWGDFDRDGQVDLYICRADSGGDDPTPDNIEALPDFLLRNDMRATGSFIDVSDSSGIVVTADNASTTASWADINGDNALDLFVGDLREYVATPLCRLYVNDGVGNFTEEFDDRFAVDDIDGVSSVAWADVDNSGSFDLVLGSQLQPPLVFFNDGTGQFDGSDPLSPDLSAPVIAVRPLDHDLDGRVDLIALPADEDDHPWVFGNRLLDTGPFLMDESSYVRLSSSTGRVDGLVSADFNEDGDSELLLGRAVDSEEFFFRAKSAGYDVPFWDWVGVKLDAGPGNNGSAIGARVRFQIGATFQQVQMIDGGSMRGGQADNILICGLGNRDGTVQAVVKWPGGYEQTVTLTRNEVTTITDSTTPGITTGSVSGTYVARPDGKADWEFTWDTNCSCKPSLDTVTITDRTNPPQCETMGTVVLTPSLSGVQSTVVAKAAGGYRHTLKWLDVDCIPPCSYNFTVESATDGSHKSTSSTRQISVGVCIE